jgi:hypothetical protein
MWCFDFVCEKLHETEQKNGCTIETELEAENSKSSKFDVTQLIKARMLEQYEKSKDDGLEIKGTSRYDLNIKYSMELKDIKRKFEYFDIDTSDPLCNQDLKDYIIEVIDAHHGKSVENNIFKASSRQVSWIMRYNNIKSFPFNVLLEFQNIENLDIPIIKLVIRERQCKYLLNILNNFKNYSAFGDFRMSPVDWLIYNPQHFDRDTEADLLNLFNLEPQHEVISLSYITKQMPTFVDLWRKSDMRGRGVNFAAENVDQIRSEYAQKLNDWIYLYYETINSLLDSGKTLYYIGTNFVIAGDSKGE